MELSCSVQILIRRACKFAGFVLVEKIGEEEEERNSENLLSPSVVQEKTITGQKELTSECLPMVELLMSGVSKGKGSSFPRSIKKQKMKRVGSKIDAFVYAQKMERGVPMLPTTIEEPTAVITPPPSLKHEEMPNFITEAENKVHSSCQEEDNHASLALVG